RGGSSPSSISLSSARTSSTPRDLVTLLGNLIDNALDSAQGSEGARVTVSVRTADGELLLRVADTGPGVPDGDAADVFRLGWSTKSEGRGLGLALVR
ncbi:sensor histidine kinase, partial [Streptomyces beijiangensis]